MTLDTRVERRESRIHRSSSRVVSSMPDGLGCLGRMEASSKVSSGVRPSRCVIVVPASCGAQRQAVASTAPWPDRRTLQGRNSAKSHVSRDRLHCAVGLRDQCCGSWSPPRVSTVGGSCVADRTDPERARCGDQLPQVGVVPVPHGVHRSRLVFSFVVRVWCESLRAMERHGVASSADAHTQGNE